MFLFRRKRHSEASAQRLRNGRDSGGGDDNDAVLGHGYNHLSSNNSSSSQSNSNNNAHRCLPEWTSGVVPTVTMVFSDPNDDDQEATNSSASTLPASSPPLHETSTMVTDGSTTCHQLPIYYSHSQHSHPSRSASSHSPVEGEQIVDIVSVSAPGREDNNHNVVQEADLEDPYYNTCVYAHDDVEHDMTMSDTSDAPLHHDVHGSTQLHLPGSFAAAIAHQRRPKTAGGCGVNDAVHDEALEPPIPEPLATLWFERRRAERWEKTTKMRLNTITRQAEERYYETVKQQGEVNAQSKSPIMDPRTGGFLQDPSSITVLPIIMATTSGSASSSSSQGPVDVDTFPVDVDTCIPTSSVAIERVIDHQNLINPGQGDDMSTPTSQSVFAPTFVGDEDTVTSLTGVGEVTVASFPSVNTSEQTIVHSNRNVNMALHRALSKQRLNDGGSKHGSDVAVGSSASEPKYGGVSLTIIPSASEETVPSGIAKGSTAHYHGHDPPSTPTQSGRKAPQRCLDTCRGFVDLNTTHGKLAALLMLLVIAAIVVLVLSVTVFDNDNDAAPPVASKDGDDILSLPMLTVAPTTSTPTYDGTSSPSTLTASPTRTRVPTQSPTVKSTTAPSSLPSAHSTVAPTFSPTNPSPTSLPTLAPTQSFASIDVVPLGGEGQNILEGPAAPDSSFGTALVMSSDGQVMAVGAPELNSRSGSVYIYHRVAHSTTTTQQTTTMFEGPQEQQALGLWEQRGVALNGLDAQGGFGSTVALSSDGSILVVGAPSGGTVRSGTVQTWRFDGQAYQTLGNNDGIIAGDAAASYAGSALALSRDGRRLAVGAPYHSGVNGRRLHGRVVVYQLQNDDTWSLMGDALHGDGDLDWFGSAVDFSADGQEMVVSAPRSSTTRGYVRLFQWNATSSLWESPWGSGGDIINAVLPTLWNDRFGHSISLSAMSRTSPDGVSMRRRSVAVGIPWKSVNEQHRAGMTIVYEWEAPKGVDHTASWNQLGEPLVQSAATAGDEAGSSVTLDDNGRLLAVGIPGASNSRGSVQLYRFDDIEEVWETHPSPLLGAEEGDDFGVSVSMTTENIEGGSVLRQDHWSLAVGSIASGRDGAGYVAAFAKI